MPHEYLLSNYYVLDPKTIAGARLTCLGEMGKKIINKWILILIIHMLRTPTGVSRLSEGCRGGESCVWDGDRPRESAQEVTRNLRPEGRRRLALRG